MAWDLKVAGVSQKTNIDSAARVEITLIQNERGTARFTTKHGYVPALRSEVQIYDTDGTTAILGGVIFSRQSRGSGATTTKTDCEVVDWTWYLDNTTIVGGTITGTYTLKQVLEWIQTNYLASRGFTLDPAQVTGPSWDVTGYSWERKTISAALRENIGPAAQGYTFYVTPAKVWGMRKANLGSPTAPFSISDATNNATVLEWTESSEDYADKVIVSYGDPPAEVTAGTGSVEKLYVLKDVSDAATAQASADGFYAAASQSPRWFTIETVTPGLRPGQVISINSAVRNASSMTAVITQVRITLQTETVWFYSADATTGIYTGSALDAWRGGGGGGGVGNVTVSVGSITGQPLTKFDDTNITLTLGGNHATALVNAASVTLGWTGQLSVPRGGTGLSSVTANRIPYGNGSSALQTHSSLTFDGTTFATAAITSTGTITAGSHLSVPAASKIYLDGQGGGTYLTEASGVALDGFVDGVQLLRLHKTNGLSVFASGGGTNFALSDAGNATLSGSIGHPSYASQTTNWRITGLGEADFRYLFVDEMHAKSFIADLEQALAGGQIIAKSVAMLATAFTMPALAASATFVVRDLPSAIGMPAFESGDTVMFRTFSRASGSLTITQALGTVSTYVDIGNGTQQWRFNRYSGSDGGGMATSTVVPADSLVIDYGVSGNGYYEVNAIDGAYGLNSPYAQIVTWATSPIAANKTIRARLGNLRGITSTANEYGLIAGTYAATNGQYFRASNSAFELHGIDLKLWDGSTNTVFINHSTPSMAIGSPVPSAYGTGAGIWMGKDSSAYKFRVGDPSADRIFWDGSNLGIISAQLTINSSGIRLNPTNTLPYTAGGSYTFTATNGSQGLGAFDDGTDRTIGIYSTRTSGTGDTTASMAASTNNAGATATTRMGVSNTGGGGAAELVLAATSGTGTIRLSPALGNIILDAQAGYVQSDTTLFGIGSMTPAFPLHVENSISNVIVRFDNTHASNPYGLQILYSATSPNDTSHEFFRGEDSTTLRVALRSNGGVANFSANNVNLSDAHAKVIAGPAPPQRELFRRLSFSLGRYADSTRTSDDLMLVAQQVAEVFPDLVEEFDREKGLLGVREHALMLRGLKVLQELDLAVTAIDQRVKSLEAK